MFINCCAIYIRQRDETRFDQGAVKMQKYALAMNA